MSEPDFFRSMLTPQRDSQGFSLIELMVVIIILAALLSIAIGLMLDMRERSYVATLKADLNAAYDAALDFHTTNPAGTATLDDLRDHGYRESLNVTLTVVNGSLDNLRITATHVGVSGVYQIDENGRISRL
jgi:prepilin-type N-terminal cleavage/methylation domain-containing protein